MKTRNKVEPYTSNHLSAFRGALGFSLPLFAWCLGTELTWGTWTFSLPQLWAFKSSRSFQHGDF